MQSMIDLHHHLLPGLDDGAKDLAASLAMARMAAADGITHIVATPHANNRYTFDPAINAGHADALRDALAGDANAPTIALGCDFHLSYDNVQDALQNPHRYTLNNTNYLLVELPDHVIPPHIEETFYELRLAGLIPILTHPERNPALQTDARRLHDWLRDGMLIQVTANSVIGNMGQKASKMAHTLLANHWVHFLATDAHNLTSRPPQMREAADLVARRYSPEYAELLCLTNPKAVFEGQPLPNQPPPLHLYDDDDLVDAPWWKRLFKGRG